MYEIVIEGIHILNALIMFTLGLIVFLGVMLWQDTKLGATVFALFYGVIILWCLFIVNDWQLALPISIKVI